MPTHTAKIFQLSEHIKLSSNVLSTLVGQEIAKTEDRLHRAIVTRAWVEDSWVVVAFDILKRPPLDLIDEDINTEMEETIYICPFCMMSIKDGIDNLIEHRKSGGECETALSEKENDDVS